MAASDSFHSLSSKVDGILSLLQSLTSKRDDQSVLMTSLAGQVQVQGERLRHIEVDLEAVRRQVMAGVLESPGDVPEGDFSKQTNASSVELNLDAVRLVVREEIKAALNTDLIREEVQFKVNDMAVDGQSQISEIKSAAEENEVKWSAMTDKSEDFGNSLNNGLIKVDNSVSALTTRLDDSISTINARLAKTNDAVNDIRSSLEDEATDIKNKSNAIENKVFRLTAIVGQTTTRFSYDLKVCKQEIRRMTCLLECYDDKTKFFLEEIRALYDELNKQTIQLDKLRNGLNNNLSQKIDNLTESSKKQGEKIEVIQSKLNGKIRVSDLSKVERCFKKTVAKEVNRLAKKQEVQKGEEMRIWRGMAAKANSIVDQIVNEAHITRDVVRNTPQTERSFNFYFHIEDFDDCVGYRIIVDSRIWYIPQLNMNLKARAIFDVNKNVTFSLDNGFYPKVFGRKLRLGYKDDFSFCVTILNQENKSDQNWKLDERRVSYRDNDYECDGWVASCGWKIGSECDCCVDSCRFNYVSGTKFSCDEIKQRDLVSEYGKVLVCFAINLE